MAVTAIWPIKGRVDRVIAYVRNPEKTTEHGYPALASLHSINGVVEYAMDSLKTENRNYVSCLNCKEELAAKQFMDTKMLWRKQGGRVCYHGYQSFQAEEVNAEQAHQIGVALARELWGRRFEVVIATHCNTGHYHNHFVINSVSFADGRKFYNSPADYARMREVSDRLCREYGISIIQQPQGRAKQYNQWQAEQNGKPTYKGIIRADIDAAIKAATTESGFLRALEAMGYAIKLRGKSGVMLKYPALKPRGAKGFFRFHKLGEGYALPEIKERILQNIHKQASLPELTKRAQRFIKPPNEAAGLAGLYYRYCYELHIIVKAPTPSERASFLLREDIDKLDKLDAETRLLAEHNIQTLPELLNYRQQLSSEIDSQTAERQALRNALRRYQRQGNTTAAALAKTQIAVISARLRELRKGVVLCEDIAERSGLIEQRLEDLQQTQQAKPNGKERDDDELFRRRGGTGRAYDIRGY